MDKLKLEIQISDSEMFRDIVALLKEISEKHPELEIPKKMQRITEKHKHTSEYLSETQDAQYKKFCTDLII